MKVLYLVGAGVGSRTETGLRTSHGTGVGTETGTASGSEGLTVSARRVLEQADVFFGAPRMLELVRDLRKPAYPVYKPDDISRVLRETQPEADRVAVLLSGDVGFYSGAAGLCRVFGETGGWDIRLEPGVSSLSAFCARLRLPWQDVAVVSMHGTDQNVVDCVRRNRHTFCLCGNNAAQVAEQLSRAGLSDVTVDVGENLGLPGDRVSRMPVETLRRAKTASLTVLLIANPDPDDRQRTGINDEAFLRKEEIPMTKSEVRAVALSRLRLSPGSVCCDVGAGTGSVTVEMALAAYKGRVYGIEPKAEALALLDENCKRFRIGNVTPVPGFAPDALISLPPPDAAFIGGSGGKLTDIVTLLCDKNPDVRLVITAVTVETAGEALRILESMELRDLEMTQISVARARNIGGVHMLAAQNPVTVLSAGGKER